MADCGLRNARAEYDAWAQTYPAVAHNPVMRAEQAVVEPLLRRLSPRRAVDVGTGSGRYLDLLASIGATAIGVDFSIGMLAARSRRIRPADGAPAGRLRLDPPRVCADARMLPIRSGCADLVNASLMVGDIADVDAWAREMARVLAGGGHLVYSDFHPNWTRLGWTRTFRDAGGATHELPFEPHTIDQHRHALAAAGFEVRLVRETGLLGDRDRAVRAFRQRWGDASVLLVLHASKR